MIKFFRKIRQQLLSENKFTKYLLYAAGEIVLVVIGILIALQVNNWNENQKLITGNKQLLHKLVDELEMNIQRIHEVETGVKEQGGKIGWMQLLETCEKASIIMSNGFNPEDVIWLMENKLFNANSLDLYSTAYQELLNTGRIYTLRNDSLTKQIQSYYSMINREEYYENKRNDEVAQALNNCKYGYIVMMIEWHDGNGFSLSNHKWILDSKSIEYKNLKMAITLTKQYLKTNLRSSDQIRRETKNLIEAIKTEIVPSNNHQYD